MLQMEGQTTVAKGGDSAERKRRYRAKAAEKPKGHHGANVIWRRVNDNYASLIKAGTDPRIVSVVNRLVLFGHLTQHEGMVAHYYGDIIRRFRRFNAELPDTARAQNYQGGRGSGDEIEQRERNGTIVEWERKAKQARKQFNRVEKVLTPFINGRDFLDAICIHEQEIASDLYPVIKAMLKLISIEFGIEQGRVPGSNNAKGTPKANDVKKAADGAVKMLEGYAKQHKLTILGYRLGEGPKGRKGPKTYFLKIVCGAGEGNPTVSPIATVNTYNMLPASLAAALIRAAEAKGWKEHVDA